MMKHGQKSQWQKNHNEHTGETVVDDGQVDFDNGGEGDDGEVV